MTKLKKLLSVVIAVSMLLQVGLPAAAAAEVIDIDAEVDVTVNVDLEAGSDPLQRDDTYTIRLVPAEDEADNPMPAGTKDGVYTEDVTGAGTVTLHIHYDALGVYQYEISQQVAEKRDSAVRYDETVYTLKVSVVREETGIEVYYAIRDKATPNGDKGPADFTNLYAETHAKVKKEWDDKNNQDGLRPAAVQVSLYSSADSGIITIVRVSRVLAML